MEEYPVLWYNIRSDQLAALNKFSKQSLAIDIKPRTLAGGMQVRGIKVRRSPLGAGGYGARHSVLI